MNNSYQHNKARRIDFRKGKNPFLVVTFYVVYNFFFYTLIHVLVFFHTKIIEFYICYRSVIKDGVWIGANDQRYEADFFWEGGGKVNYTSKLCSYN